MGYIWFATIASYCKIEQDVLPEAVTWIRERIVVIAIDTVVAGLGEVHLVEQFSVEIETDEVLIPVHSPNMELRSPVGILCCEMGEWRDALVPYCRVSLV